MTPMTLRSVSMTKVLRFTGMSPPPRLTPKMSATVRSGSERRGKSKLYLSENCFCFSTVSAEMPTRWPPASSNSFFRSRK